MGSAIRDGSRRSSAVFREAALPWEGCVHRRREDAVSERLEQFRKVDRLCGTCSSIFCANSYRSDDFIRAECALSRDMLLFSARRKTVGAEDSGEKRRPTPSFDAKRAIRQAGALGGLLRDRGENAGVDRRTPRSGPHFLRAAASSHRRCAARLDEARRPKQLALGFLPQFSARARAAFGSGVAPGSVRCRARRSAGCRSAFRDRRERPVSARARSCTLRAPGAPGVVIGSACARLRHRHKSGRDVGLRRRGSVLRATGAKIENLVAGRAPHSSAASCEPSS